MQATLCPKRSETISFWTEIKVKVSMARHDHIVYGRLSRFFSRYFSLQFLGLKPATYQGLYCDQ